MKQAAKVNKYRGKNFKEHLDVGDICLIRIEGNTRAATDKSAIIVMVTQVHVYRSRTDCSLLQKYQVCTKDGYLKHLQDRSTLEFQPNVTGDLMGIDISIPNFQTDLSVTDASRLFNMLGGSVFCKCTTDCAKNKNCKCKKQGTLCSSRCHGGRGNNKFCTWCNF
jgi:hypothetical protein